MDLSWLSMFFDSSKVGGYVRAFVASGLTTLLIKEPILAPFIGDPVTQAAIATVASGLAVGVWSHITKKSSTPTS